ncbi:MAG: hypothetical protein C0508_11400 [Cyanobacteria bacterium PR.023]|nr:hypothetical protein [Cyanobacteria bacterium PR.023]
MTILRNFFVSALLASAFLNLTLGTRLEAAPALAPRNQDKATGKVTKSAVKTQVHRFDFRLEGVSCGRCIVNIRKALRLTKGVSRCEVALRKPYGGVVIYDPAQTDVKKLTQITITADPKTTVTVKDPVDESIQNVPTVLIPKYTSLQKTPG